MCVCGGEFCRELLEVHSGHFCYNTGRINTGGEGGGGVHSLLNVTRKKKRSKRFFFCRELLLFDTLTDFCVAILYDSNFITFVMVLLVIFLSVLVFPHIGI